MFFLKLDLPSGNCVKGKNVITFLVSISLTVVSCKGSQARESNSFTDLQPI